MSARFRVRVPDPVSGQLYETACGELAICLAFLFPFGRRPSLLGHPGPPGNWALLAVGLPAHPEVRRTLSGFPCSTRMRCGWGWVSSVLRGRRCPHGQAMSLAAICRFTGMPLAPRQCYPSRRVTITKHQQGFTSVHPMPSLPLACDSQTERESLGFPLGFTPDRAGLGHACQGRDEPWTLARTTSSISVDPPSTYSLITCDLTSQHRVVVRVRPTTPP